MPNLNVINNIPPKGLTPELGRVKVATALFGVSRSWIYRAGAAHPNLLRKLGRSTLIDLNMLRSILAALPAAELRRPATERTS